MSRLLRALDRLEAEFALSRERVHRTEVGKDGRLVLHVDAAEGPRWFVEDEQALLERHPSDERSLPGLATFLAEGRRHQVFGWRPARRFVVRVDDSPTYALKFFRRGQAAAARSAHTLAAAIPGGFRVPRGLVTTHTDALAFEWISGADEFHFGHAEERFLALGRGLARMQAHSDRGLAPIHGRAQELAVLARWEERYTTVAGAPPAGWRALASELESRASSSAELVLAHRDLHEGQILFLADEIVVLDFDLLARAERELDLANLAAHAELATLQGSRGATPASAGHFARALLAGYREGAATPSRAAWSFWTSAAFLRLALVHGLRPRSFHLVEPLVELARGALDTDPPRT